MFSIVILGAAEAHRREPEGRRVRDAAGPRIAMNIMDLILGIRLRLWVRRRVRDAAGETSYEYYYYYYYHYAVRLAMNIIIIVVIMLWD